jgi:hypothetical protein
MDQNKYNSLRPFIKQLWDKKIIRWGYRNKKKVKNEQRRGLDQIKKRKI